MGPSSDLARRDFASHGERDYVSWMLDMVQHPLRHRIHITMACTMQESSGHAAHIRNLSFAMTERIAFASQLEEFPQAQHLVYRDESGEDAVSVGAGRQQVAHTAPLPLYGHVAMANSSRVYRPMIPIRISRLRGTICTLLRASGSGSCSCSPTCLWCGRRGAASSCSS